MSKAGFQPYEKTALPGERISATMHAAKLGRQKKTQIIQYDSPQDLLKDYYHNTANKTWHTMNYNKTRNLFEFDKYFTVGSDYKSLPDVLNDIRDGRAPVKYLTQIDRAKNKMFQDYPDLEELSVQAAGYRKKMTYGEDGYDVCVDRYLANDDNCMLTNRRHKGQRQPKKSVRLFMNVGLSGGTSTQTFVDNMIVFTAINDIFETAGIAVEILVGDLSYLRSCPTVGNVLVATKIKSANEPLDQAALMSTGQPAFFRELGFYTLVNLVEMFDQDGIGTPVHDLDNAPTLQAAMEFLEIDIAIIQNNLMWQIPRIIKEIRAILDGNKISEAA